MLLIHRGDHDAGAGRQDADHRRPFVEIKEAIGGRLMFEAKRRLLGRRLGALGDGG